MYHVRTHFGNFRLEGFRFYVEKEMTYSNMRSRVERLKMSLSRLCRELDIDVPQVAILGDAVVKVFCDGQYAEIVVPVLRMPRTGRIPPRGDV